ncbi:MAG: hypothetical protein ACK42K_13285, partial [Leptonema sp. (in: bacteria)]
MPYDSTSFFLDKKTGKILLPEDITKPVDFSLEELLNMRTTQEDTISNQVLLKSIYYPVLIDAFFEEIPVNIVEDFYIFYSDNNFVFYPLKEQVIKLFPRKFDSIIPISHNIAFIKEAEKEYIAFINDGVVSGKEIKKEDRKYIFSEVYGDNVIASSWNGYPMTVLNLKTFDFVFLLTIAGL